MLEVGLHCQTNKNRWYHSPACMHNPRKMNNKKLVNLYSDIINSESHTRADTLTCVYSPMEICVTCRSRRSVGMFGGGASLLEEPTSYLVGTEYFEITERPTAWA